MRIVLQFVGQLLQTKQMCYRSFLARDFLLIRYSLIIMFGVRSCVNAAAVHHSNILYDRGHFTPFKSKAISPDTPLSTGINNRLLQQCTMGKCIENRQKKFMRQHHQLFTVGE
jgi:hypothetical protein